MPRAASAALQATDAVIAVGSSSKRPAGGRHRDHPRHGPIEDATSARRLPQSLLVLGGGPTGVELAQVYARFGVPVTVVQSGARLARPITHGTRTRRCER